MEESETQSTMRRSQSSVFRWLLFQQYDHAMSVAEKALNKLNQYQDRLLSGMDSDTSEAMAPDEMYLMLQADMISIKQQEEALQSEIEEIATKFHALLETCGTDSDRDSGTMAPPSTPSFMKNTASSLTHVTNLETPTFMKQLHGQTLYTTLSLSPDSDEETRTLFPDNASFSEPVVNSSDGLPLDVSVLSSKTLVLDNNSNYLESPHNEMAPHTPVIEAITSLENTSSSTNSTSNSSSSSSHRMSSSDGYPKSDESTDNQIVPECYDLDKEFMSRLQYYSDFTVDRQRKINSIVSKLGCSVADNSPCAVTEELLERHVEGKESSPEKPAFVKPAPVPVVNSGSSSDYMSTPTSRHVRSRRERSHRHHSRSSKKRSSVPLANSTMLDSSFSSSGSSSHRGYSAAPQASSTMICESESSSGSSRRNRTNGSNPRACSTMLNESFLSSGSTGSGSSRHKSSSIPQANSTMICEASLPALCGGEPSMSAIHSGSRQSLVSDNDCESVYTWSIHDGDSGSDRDISLEESYIKNITHSNKKTIHKPPLPPSKRHRSDSVSSRDSDSEKQCQDHKLHKLLGEPCSKDILETVSVIQPNGCHDGDMFVNSLYDDTECAVPKANTIPRSSTRVKLQDKSSGSSSMEARRPSLPDLTSVCTSNNNDDQSVPESITSESEEDNAMLPERLECQGKSSSSTDNPSVSASQLEPSQLSQGSGGHIDSILTDSPNSVCSSGINAPYNSPGTNQSSSSRVSCSTTSDARSSDSNFNTRAPPVTLLPRNIPLTSDSPKVQNVEQPQGGAASVFKVPKQNLPLRHLFKFGRKAKSPKVKTPVAAARPVSDDGEGRPRRQLFPSAGTANLQQEARVMDKKAVIKKFKRFSSSFGKTDRSGRPKIETLANL